MDFLIYRADSGQNAGLIVTEALDLPVLVVEGSLDVGAEPQHAVLN